MWGSGTSLRCSPPEQVDAVLAETQVHEVRQRLLPPRLTGYFVLARALFCPEPCHEVLRLLAEPARHEDGWGSWRVPDKAAVFRARRKLGVEPFRNCWCTLVRWWRTSGRRVRSGGASGDGDRRHHARGGRHRRE
ncbi:transposase domain-containing protein [Streptomyces canus]|uniref:transposase domain-containing protein n=1 Tax=Streptomyces canus TaxID=58343 RepID=UPI00358F5B91